MTNSKTAVGNHYAGAADGDGVKRTTTSGQHLLRQGLSATGAPGEQTTDARRKTRSAGKLSNSQLILNLKSTLLFRHM